MATTQLNCRVEVLLAKRLREAATARHTTTGALVAQAIEALLEGNSSSPAPPPSALAALEARVAKLEAITNRDIVTVKNITGKVPGVTGDITTDEAIPTAALADLLGIKRGAINARIARAGGAAPGLVIEGWSCVGLAVPKRGGPAQALWQQA
jgi:hypothetical protein